MGRPGALSKQLHGRGVDSTILPGGILPTAPWQVKHYRWIWDSSPVDTGTLGSPESVHPHPQALNIDQSLPMEQVLLAALLSWDLCQMPLEPGSALVLTVKIGPQIRCQKQAQERFSSPQQQLIVSFPRQDLCTGEPPRILI